MLSILINAYACGPNKGSEPGVGWNWVISLAQKCEVFVITEGEFKEDIERELKKIPQKNRIHFYYLPVKNKVREMCWNQGDWRFYRYYKKWQRNALKLAYKIMDEHIIDIVHQLNMIGFREPGYLWKIKDRPFVWGPIGGMNMFPESYLIKAGCKRTFFVKLKNKINFFQMKFHKRVKKAIIRADALISAIPESQVGIKLYHGKDSYLISETGCYINQSEHINLNLKKREESFNILWVGRFLYSKQLELALRTIEKIKDLPGLRFHIVGSGNKHNYYKAIADSLGINHICTWYGQISNNEVHQLMKNSQLFFFSSISEATSTVVLEALENHLPVLCFNTCGFGAVIDETVGTKIELSYPSKSVNEFAKKIKYLYNNREELVQMSVNCSRKAIELSWEGKINHICAIYNDVLNRYDKDSSRR